MDKLLDRRQFMKVVSSGLCAVGLGSVCYGASRASKGSEPIIGSVHLISGDPASGAGQRSRAWGYLPEILERAGVFHERHTARDIEKPMEIPGAIIVLVGNLILGAKQRDALKGWVAAGGCLLGIGGSSGLNEVFGVASETPLADAWIVPAAGENPIFSGLRSSLHVFGGYTLKPGGAKVLAGIAGGSAYVKGNSVLENCFGNGRTVLIGPDLVFSIVHIQQGISVLQDGKPPADGSADVDDGVLKAEDGSVLDWNRDRTAVAPEGQIFIEPVADELREILLRCLFNLAQSQGTTMPILWQWPRSLKAVAMMSHDTDGNDPAKAVVMLDVLRRCNLKSTWCILYPGGYPREFFGTLAHENFEIALHYDAMTGGEKTSWSKHNFLLQHRWLMDQAGLNHITTNKNHYTRWEERLELWRWCEEAGIGADQTRGPSKKGTIGFPLGGSQPYFPWDDEDERCRRMRVLEVNLLTQDLVVTCPPEYGRQLVDSALRHHGVAHFLFHPAHIKERGVADALAGVVDYGRSAGLEWWTSQQILEWETRRRGVKCRLDRKGGLRLHSERALPEGTLLFLRTTAGPGLAQVGGTPVQGKAWNLYGFQFDAIETPIAGETVVQWKPV